MKKIVALLLALTVVFALASCSGAKDPCEKHVDDDNDKICDVCQEKIEETPAAQGLKVADFAQAMKGTNASRVEISIIETSELGSLAAKYIVTFGSGDSASIYYEREAWDVSDNVFDGENSGKIKKSGTVQYANGAYSGDMSGAADSVAKLALDLDESKLASVTIIGSAASGSTMSAAVPRAHSAEILGVQLAGDTTLSVTMRAGAKSISAFTLSYVANGQTVAFSALYE